jgi:hypothetical protein
MYLLFINFLRTLPIDRPSFPNTLVHSSCEETIYSKHISRQMRNSAAEILETTIERFQDLQ